jgi:thioredoxin-dependent peroxiredoxin
MKVGDKMALKEGMKAPDFILKDTDGHSVKLGNFIGKQVVLYFYPKDDTPGCTIEACSFRDNVSDIKKKNAIVLGVSTDNEESHVKFTKKYKLNFPLLADTEMEVSKKYGVYGEKSFMGRKFMGINRTTFIIDKAGKIKKIFPKVSVNGHAKEVLNNL